MKRQDIYKIIRQAVDSLNNNNCPTNARYLEEALDALKELDATHEPTSIHQLQQMSIADLTALIKHAELEEAKYRVYNQKTADKWAEITRDANSEIKRRIKTLGYDIP